MNDTGDVLRDLRRLEQRHRELLDTLPHGIEEVDLDGRIVVSNAAHHRMHGYADGELVGRSVLEIVAPGEERERLRELLTTLRDDQPEPVAFETVDLTKDGRRIHVRFDWNYRRDESGAVIGYVGIVTDITDRKAVKEALREQEAHFRSLMENAERFVLYRLRSRPGEAYAGEVVFVSPSIREVMGVDDPMDFGSWFAHIHPDDLPRVVAANNRSAETGETFDEEMRIRHPERGETRWIRALSRAIQAEDAQYFNGLIFDITELKRAEEERRRIETGLQRAQRLESLGVLAGGIAHDFNNLLQGILGNAGLGLAAAAGRGGSPEEFLRNIETAAQRAADLTHQMLAYSGQERFAAKAMDVNAVVEEMVQLLRTVVAKSAILSFDLDEGPLTIEGDAAQIGQVVMNLLTNASEALGGAHGVITVRTGRDAAPGGFEVVRPPPDGPCVCLEVNDTGCGMDADVARRIFDPFFTTKFTGRGLGLAAVHGIVRSHQGGLLVRSAPGRGTTFRVCFPASKAVIAAAAPLDEAAGAESLVGTTALVVDDEPTVRAVASAVLEREGAEVITARDGADALEILAAERDRIGVVLLDLTMPRFGGADTYRELRKSFESLPVVLSSGYSEEETKLRFAGAADDPRAAFVKKPYRPSDLLAAVETVCSHAR